MTSLACKGFLFLWGTGYPQLAWPHLDIFALCGSGVCWLAKKAYFHPDLDPFWGEAQERVHNDLWVPESRPKAVQSFADVQEGIETYSQGWMRELVEEIMATAVITESSCVWRETCHPAIFELRQEDKKAHLVSPTVSCSLSGFSLIHTHMSSKKVGP